MHTENLLEFIILSLFCILVVIWFKMPPKRKVYNDILWEFSHYENIDLLLEQEIITPYEHKELIRRLKERNQ